MTEVEQQPKVEQSEKEEVSGETEDKALNVGGRTRKKLGHVKIR